MNDQAGADGSWKVRMVPGRTRVTAVLPNGLGLASSEWIDLRPGASREIELANATGILIVELDESTAIPEPGGLWVYLDCDDFGAASLLRSEWYSPPRARAGSGAWTSHRVEVGRVGVGMRTFRARIFAIAQLTETAARHDPLVDVAPREIEIRAGESTIVRIP